MKASSVEIIKPDFVLKRKIGTPLSYIFNPERVEAAQSIFDQGKERLAEECLEHVELLRKLCDAPDAPEKIPLSELTRLILNVKGASLMAGYPIAGQLATLLYGLLAKIKQMDRTTITMALTISDAIKAVFREKRMSATDEVSRAVINEMGAQIEIYLKTQGSRS
jgi:hypothetical protein